MSEDDKRYDFSGFSDPSNPGKNDSTLATQAQLLAGQMAQLNPTWSHQVNPGNAVGSKANEPS